ncbi:MAG: hypothetical protein MZV63_36340 [Marinilabiliales bacterium]|nr:hypothetical protein [Marinilabiliales bacterium]
MAAGEITGCKGKIFYNGITPDGKEIDVTGAKAIAFTVEGSGQSDASAVVFRFLP